MSMISSLIDRLQEAADSIEDYYEDELNEEVLLLKEAAETIKILSEKVRNQRWISVSERLPEESLNSVIGWDVYRERCVFVQYIDGYFQIMGSDEIFNIVAWMPLPEPYNPQAESEDKE